MRGRSGRGLKGRCFERTSELFRDLLEGVPTEGDFDRVGQRRPSRPVAEGQFRRAVDGFDAPSALTPWPFVSYVPQPAGFLEPFKVLGDSGDRAAPELFLELLGPAGKLRDDLEPNGHGKDHGQPPQVIHPLPDAYPDPAHSFSANPIDLIEGGAV